MITLNRLKMNLIYIEYISQTSLSLYYNQTIKDLIVYAYYNSRYIDYSLS